MTKLAEDTDRIAKKLAATPRQSGRRLRGAVAEFLGAAIVSGQIAPGERLEGEVANAEALNVSRSAYREAIQVLSAKGLVVSKPKDGTRVLPRQNWNMLDPMVLGWAFNDEPDMDFVRDLFELRSVVEPAVARLAALRRSAEHVSAMREDLKVMLKEGLIEEKGRAADRRFHETMLKASDNEAMMALSASIGAAVSFTTLFKSRKRGIARDPVPDHKRVLDAIEARDPSAAEAAMRDLLDLALEDTRAVMAKASNS